MPDEYIESLVGKKIAYRCGGKAKHEEAWLLAFVTEHSHPSKGFQHGHLVLWDDRWNKLYTISLPKAPYIAPIEGEEIVCTTSFNLQGGGKVVVVLPVPSKA